MDASLKVNEKVRKAFITYNIEETLSSKDEHLYENTCEKLNRSFGCKIIDCYEHPEYLKQVLQELVGTSCISIISSISKNLEEFYSDQFVYRFVNRLTNN